MSGSDFRDVLATEDSDQVVDIGARLQQGIFLTFSEAARHDHAAQFALAFQVEHLVDRSKRFRSRSFNETARVDDSEVGAARLVHELVTIKLQQAEHALAVDEVLRAAKADKRIAALGFAARTLSGESVRHVCLKDFDGQIGWQSDAQRLVRSATMNH